MMMDVNEQIALQVMNWNGTTAAWYRCADKFCPAENILDAFKVIEKLEVDGYVYCISNMQVDQQSLHYAGFKLNNGTWWHTSRASTPSLAICLAALDAVSKKIKERI